MRCLFISCRAAFYLYIARNYEAVMIANGGNVEYGSEVRYIR